MHELNSDIVNTTTSTACNFFIPICFIVLFSEFMELPLRNRYSAAIVLPVVTTVTVMTIVPMSVSISMSVSVAAPVTISVTAIVAASAWHRDNTGTKQ
jgi:hypothetical protein